MEKSSRNYGIDLLRIVAMFFVVTLHSLNHGGVLSNVSVSTNQFNIAWLLEIISYCAVDIFAIISGYVMWNRKANYTKVINLWFQVVFYCLIITLFFNIIKPEYVSKTDYIKSFFPILNNSYWYFTAYIGLFLIKPFIDKAIQMTVKKTLKKIFILIIILFSFFDIIANRFTLNNGYSVIWLIILYILGAIISKCEIGKKINNIWIICGIVLLIIITFLVKISNFDNIYFLEKTFGLVINKDLFINYISPTILGISILTIIGVSRIEFNNFTKKIITFSSSSAFAIYLINEQYLFRENILRNRFVYLANSSVITLFFHIILFSILFVIISIFIDKIRILLFKVFKIDKLTNNIYILINKSLNKLSNII